jgi:hypothetical protein
MGEALPILSGAALGALIGLCRARISRSALAALVALFAAIATVASDEFRLAWSYVLVDAAEVLVGLVFAMLLTRRLRTRQGHGWKGV